MRKTKPAIESNILRDYTSGGKVSYIANKYGVGRSTIRDIANRAHAHRRNTPRASDKAVIACFFVSAGHNKREVAQLLNISRSTLYNLIKDHSHKVHPHRYTQHLKRRAPPSAGC